MRYCNYCKNPLEEGEKYCPFCGHEVGTVNHNGQQPKAGNIQKPYPSNPHKRGPLIVLIIALIILLVVCGILAYCLFSSKKESTSAETDAKTEESQSENLSEEKEPEEAESEEKTASRVIFEKQTGSAIESASLTGVSDTGETVWTYTTGSYELAQLDHIYDLGEHDGQYYICEEGNIRAFDSKTGSLVWENPDFGGAAYGKTFDNDGNLYVCGYLGPELFVVDRNGKELKKIDTLYEGITNPYKLELNGDMLAVTMENIGKGETIVYVNIKDYSVSLSAAGSTDAAGSTVNSVTMGAVSGVSASSYLAEPQYGITHWPENVIDGSLSNTWVEAAQGQGIGESLTIQLNGQYKVSGFTINAGLQESADLYEKNSRPSLLTVSFSDGSSVQVSLDDVNGPQSISFSTPVTTSSVTFTIDSVYAGYKYEDTVISEISLY